MPGHQKLRGSETLRRLRRENTLEGPQRLPSESRSVTHVSRLQAVQAAVDHQLGEMAREFPHRRVGLVTFSYEVCLNVFFVSLNIIFVDIVHLNVFCCFLFTIICIDFFKTFFFFFYACIGKIFSVAIRFQSLKEELK